MEDKMEGIAKSELKESARVKEASFALAPQVAKAAKLVISAFKSGKKLLLCGNGGSAADAQHIAAEFVGRFAMDRKALPAIALHANTSTITAIANDHGFERVFSRQIEAFGNEGDVLIAISTSGNSPNIIEAVKQAKKAKMKTIGLLGRGGGRLAPLVDLAIVVPSDSTPRVQEVHITIGHIIAGLTEKELFGNV